MIRQRNMDRKSAAGEILLASTVEKGGADIVGDVAYFSDIVKIEVTRLQANWGAATGGSSPTLTAKIRSFTDAVDPFTTTGGTIEYTDTARDLTSNSALEVRNASGSPLATLTAVQQTENNTNEKGIGLQLFLAIAGSPTSTEIGVKVYGRVYQNGEI